VMLRCSVSERVTGGADVWAKQALAANTNVTKLKGDAIRNIGQILA